MKDIKEILVANGATINKERTDYKEFGKIEYITFKKYYYGKELGIIIEIDHEDGTLDDEEYGLLKEWLDENNR